MKRFIPVALALISLGLAPAEAHHSLSAYNRTTDRTIEGVVKTFRWSNPHVRIVLTVERPDGRPIDWNFEGGSINRLANSGFNRAMIVSGDRITVTYNPRRDGKPGGFFTGVTSKDGRVYTTERLPGRGGAEEG